MNRLADAIAQHIIQHVAAQVHNLNADSTEFRAVFNGPPIEILEEVFALLAERDGIEATLGNGERVCIPVVLQLENLPVAWRNPPIGKSGKCNANHLLDLRNSPHCPRFIGLVQPGQQANLSQASTRSDFGVSPQNNSGSASISDWWTDKFIQGLVDGALRQHGALANGQLEEARKLAERAVHAADEADNHGTQRCAAWKILARLWSTADTEPMSFGTAISLATGFPPMADGMLDADAQVRALRDLMGRLESEGFRPAIEQLKERAEGDDERVSLSEVLRHLQFNCDIPTALTRAAPHYYSPLTGQQVESPPQWWASLTVETWNRFLEEDDKPTGAIKVTCLNSFTPPTNGLLATKSEVKLRISLPENVTGPTNVTLTREVTGTKGHKTWEQQVVDGTIEIVDDDLPPHKAPVRYSATAEGLKKGSLKVISLANWLPGFIVCSRTASKVTPPKPPRSSRERHGHELSMVLNGEGRHYLDFYVAPGFTLLGRNITANDENGSASRATTFPIAEVSDEEYGVEVEAASGRYFEFPIAHEGAPRDSGVRIYVSCDEVSPEECSSEFERLIRLNRQRDGARATTAVHVNTQARSSYLQGWLLDAAKVEHSYYPSVLAPDYAEQWRPRDWAKQADTIFSRGRFLNDPRPSPGEMDPPPAFLHARKEIAAKIRGEDGDGLVEIARLGEWLATDPQFAELVEQYVRAYSEWLDAAPELAAWCDISIFCGFESDQATLDQEPDAVLVSPLHPARFAWHCLAQRALFLAAKKAPCPAASVLDPDCIPDSLALPLRLPSGGTKYRVFFSVECSSDYWSILWNSERLSRLAAVAGKAPFDPEFGVLVGGISSGFSVSQVHRALNDVSGMLMSKPVLSVLVSSAAGQNNACNEGLISWCKEYFAARSADQPRLAGLGDRFIQVLDERGALARPSDADISNLAEDTGNKVRWYERFSNEMVPDLGIIAQLETSSASQEESKVSSPLAAGGLIRARIRQQLKAQAGAFLTESRAGASVALTDDGLADKVALAIVKLENLGNTRPGYSFAPSIHAIQGVLKKADYAAVSSTAVDPACFLGNWLEGSYLWDFDLPSYSSRSGDSNGYYLLSRVKEVDRDVLGKTLSKLPGCNNLQGEAVDNVLLEVARRGIPTVRGLSSGDAGASGDLGLFIAARLLQDEFSIIPRAPSLLPAWTQDEDAVHVTLIIPVDPFKGYLDDLTRAVGKGTSQRPDLVVFAATVTDSHVRCKITPVEVKYRGSQGPMPAAHRLEALEQAKSMSALLVALQDRAKIPELALWKLAFHHLLVSMLNFGFRVYSQQEMVSNHAPKWAELHARLISAVFAEDIDLDFDKRGRLIVIDGSVQSGALDHDGDGFTETIVLCHADAALVARGDGDAVYDMARARVKDWSLLPGNEPTVHPVLGAAPPGTSGDPLPALGTAPGNACGDSLGDGRPAVGGLPGHQGDGDGDAQPPSEPEHEPLPEVPIGPQQSQDVGNPMAEIGHQAGVKLLIGQTVDGFRSESRTLNLSDTRLNQLNIGVVGDLGTGKTQLLKSLIYQIAKAKESNQGIAPRFLIFDYKRDYSSEEFVKAVGARVVKPRHLPINLFDTSGAADSMTPWLDRFKFFSDVLDKIFSGVGPVQRANLKNAVKQAYATCVPEGRQPTIYDVHANYHALVAKADSVSAIIDDLVDMEIFSPDTNRTSGFGEFLDGVVVISLDALGQDDRTKNMLVAIMLNMFYEHMLRIPKRPFIGVDPQLRVVDSFLLVDEADNIMRYEFDVLRKLLLQGREFGVGIILASQYLRHFKAGATDYREPLLTWFVHKVPNVVPQELSALGLTGDVSHLTDRIKSLEVHHCLFKTFNTAGDIMKGQPFYSLPKDET